jgi:uncharacterized protein (TIGR02679 family)
MTGPGVTGTHDRRSQADADRLARVLGTPELAWLVDRVRVRITRGMPLDGGVTLTGATPAQRQAAARLLGRPAGRGSSLSVPLPAVEAVLRASGLADDLRTAVEALSGEVPDLAAERARLAARREAAVAAARAARHAGEEWHEAWLADVTADGTLTRLLGAGRDAALGQAAAILGLLPATELPLPVLAERVTGDTKALSVPPLPGLVLRALSRWQWQSAPPDGTPQTVPQTTPQAMPLTAAGRRALWERFGVIVDDLASQVLVLGLPASGGMLGRWLTEAAAGGMPFRVTLHQLSAMPVILDVPVVYVCENPAVLRAAAAELGPGCAPLVCTEGIPSAACHRLLGAARQLCWRGDFDWTGLRTTAAAVARYRARPWRMSADDFCAALAEGDSEPLKGASAESPWDLDLAAQMRSTGRAVMEERLIPALLSDLAAARLTA